MSDADLRSIAEARRAAEAAHEAQRRFAGTDPEDIDRMVEAMARAIEVEAARLGELAVEETGYGNAEDKRIKNLFNALAVAEWLAKRQDARRVVARPGHQGDGDR